MIHYSSDPGGAYAGMLALPLGLYTALRATLAGSNYSKRPLDAVRPFICNISICSQGTHTRSIQKHALISIFGCSSQREL